MHFSEILAESMAVISCTVYDIQPHTHIFALLKITNLQKPILGLFNSPVIPKVIPAELRNAVCTLYSGN